MKETNEREEKIEKDSTPGWKKITSSGDNNF